MRRTFALSAVLALLVAATGVAFAGASTSGDDDGHNDDRGDRPRVHVLQVERNAGTDVVLDLDHSGSSALTIGDEIVSTAEFFIGDKEVGKDGAVCTKARTPEWFHCVATNSFDEGDLTVQFFADFNITRTWAFRDHRRYARVSRCHRRGHLRRQPGTRTRQRHLPLHHPPLKNPTRPASRGAGLPVGDVELHGAGGFSVPRATGSGGTTWAGQRRFHAQPRSPERLESNRRWILGLAAGTGHPGYRDGRPGVARRGADTRGRATA